MGKRNSMPRNGKGIKGANNKNAGPAERAPAADESMELQLASELAAEKAKRQELEQLLVSYEEDMQQQAEKLAAEERKSQEFQSQVDRSNKVVASLHVEAEKRELHIDSAEKENANQAKELAENSTMMGTFRQKISELNKKAAAEEERWTNFYRKEDEKSAAENDLEAKLEERDLKIQTLMEEIRNPPSQGENEHLKSELSKVKDELASTNQGLLDTEAELAALRDERQMDSKPTFTTLSTELEGLEGRERAVPLFGESIFKGFTSGQKETPHAASIFSQMPYTPVSRPITWPRDRNTVSTGTQTDKVKDKQACTETAGMGAPTSIFSQMPCTPAPISFTSSRDINTVSTGIQADKVKDKQACTGAPTSIFSQMPGTPDPRSYIWSWDKNTVSTGTQTDKVKVKQACTETTGMGASTSEASVQTVRVAGVQVWTQTENSEVPEMKDASVLTDPVFVRKLETDGWKKFLSMVLMLMSVVILFKFYFAEKGMWTAANDVSRQALISRNGPSLSPWWYQVARYQLTVWMQVDRVLSG